MFSVLILNVVKVEYFFMCFKFLYSFHLGFSWFNLSCFSALIYIYIDFSFNSVVHFMSSKYNFLRNRITFQNKISLLNVNALLTNNKQCIYYSIY